MRVFLDFEASSLANKTSYPIEVGWVFEDGREEDHLIRPAPDWTDWDPSAEAVHGIPRAELLARGEPHDQVAGRMVETLTGHDLYATAPSWDGHWLSVLLRASSLPRHALKLRDSDQAHLEAAEAAGLDMAAAILLLKAARRDLAPPGHRALADARQELEVHLQIKRYAAAAAPMDLPRE